MSVSSKCLELYGAIRRNDIKGGESLISANPDLLDLAAQTWPENPLILAYRLKSIDFVSMILWLKPELACQKNQDGNTVLHLACSYGDEGMVRNLVCLGFHELCYQEDAQSLIPLQKAVLHGSVGVIELLLSACPKSIGVRTPQNQTVFHLAAENYKADVFEVLLQYANELNKANLLDELDNQGNNVLHISVRKKQLRIVKLCLLDLSSTAGHGFANRVDAKNIDGHTPLDLYNRISDADNDFETLEIQAIGRTLREASGSSYMKSVRYSKTITIPTGRTLETKNVLLVVLAIFMGLAFTVTCALSSLFPHEYLVAISVVFELKDIVYGKLPHIFYIMSLITVLISTSTCILSVLLYSLPGGTLMLVGGVATFIIYLLLANYVVPEFSVRVGSHHVPSNYLMVIFALGFIIIGVLIIHLGNFLMPRSFNHAKWVMKKVVSKFRPPSNDMLPLRNPSFGVQMVGTAI